MEMNKSDSERLRDLADWIDSVENVLVDTDMMPVEIYDIAVTNNDLRRIADTIEALRPLTGNEQKAFDAFVEVCNEPIPEGEGKEYLNGMIKMKAFMAGRAMEYEHVQFELKRLEGINDTIERKAVSDEDIQEGASISSKTESIMAQAVAHCYFELGAKWVRNKMTGI